MPVTRHVNPLYDMPEESYDAITPVGLVNRFHQEPSGEGGYSELPMGFGFPSANTPSAQPSGYLDVQALPAEAADVGYLDLQGDQVPVPTSSGAPRAETGQYFDVAPLSE
jgi:hypothetical protein